MTTTSQRSRCAPSLRFPGMARLGAATLTTSLLATGLLIGSSPAVSQEAADQKQAVIEEIVVTSRKREERLQEVPISVSVFSAEDMEMKSLTSLKEIGQFTPNFTFFNHGQQGRTSGLLFIRGVGQTDPLVTNDPGVGLYVDGVYLGRMQALDLDLMDLERIEILRGPQGTLFGKNTTGGAVNVVTAKPGDEFAAKAQFTTGRFDRADGKLSINIPLVEGKLAMKIAGSTRNRDGYGRRLDFFTGNMTDRMGNQNTLSGRMLLRWTPTPDLEVLFSIDGTRVREEGPVRKVVAIGQPFAVSVLNMFVDPPYDNRFITDSPFTNFATGGNGNRLDAGGGSLNVTWDFGNWSLKSISAYRTFDALNLVDPDGSPYSIIDQDNDIGQEQFSQEVQLTGESLDGRLKWVVGGYYFYEDIRSTIPVVVFKELLDIIGLDLSLTWDLTGTNKSYAGFGQATYDITDKLSVTAGLRYTYEKKAVGRVVFRQFTSVTLAPPNRKSGNWDAVSPRVGLEYQWTRDLMTYASVARGFKSGGINGRSSSAFDFDLYNPEFLWTYEAGFKSDWLDRRLRLNSSFFYSDYKDIQFTVIKGSAGAEPIIVVDNAAAAEIKGFEAELVVVPAAGLRLNAGIGFIDAQFTKADPTADVNTSSKFQKTPKWSVMLGGQYSFPLANLGSLTARVDYAYKSTIQHDAANSPLIAQDGYSLVNARLTFEDINGRWQLAVFGTNLGNTKYILAGTDFVNSLGFAEVQFGRPREWGLSLSLIY